MTRRPQRTQGCFADPPARAAGPLAYHPLHPYRPPWWRWGRAMQLRDGRLGARRVDDAWVRRARRLLAALDRLGGDAGHPRVVAADPPSAAAARLHSITGDRTRAEVEARLLAGQGDIDIAGRVGLDVDVVEAFENLFFDVRPHLEATDWITFSVLGLGPCGGGVADAARESRAAHLVGYALGPAAVDVAFGRVPAGADMAGLAGEMGRFVALAATPVTPRDARRWLALAGRLDELEREAASASAAPVFGPVRVGSGALTAAAGPDSATDPGPGGDGLDLRRDGGPVVGPIAVDYTSLLRRFG